MMFGQSRLTILAATSVIVLVLALAAPAALAAASATTISSDAFNQTTCHGSTTTNHQTEVEPDTFSNGSTIVATFQVGRIFDGGACAIGFATSTNSGTSWTNGLLPGITKWTTSPTSARGSNDRATDASVAYDAKHGVWLISSLTLLEAGGIHGNSVVTSTSSDGLTWGSPFTTATGADLDKNWIVCDNTSTSPHYGNCYTQWDNHAAGNLLQMSRSTDGGQHWSAPATNNTGVIGGQPVVRPDGTVIVPIDNANETAVGAFNSTDGGLTWSSPTTIATIKHHTVAGNLREGPLPSAEIDSAGTVYVAWDDCRFRRGCKTNDIVVSHSLNATGTSWSPVSRVPIDGTNSGIDHFIPGLAVDKLTSGSAAGLGITYYFYPPKSTQLSVGFVSSTNAGSTWSTPQTLASGMPVGWTATTSQGRMVGDYISTSFDANHLAHGVFATASTPTSGTNCSDVLDNCREPTATFSVGLAAGSASSAADPVLFAGSGGASANGLWNVVDNNGSKHRD
jgi:BNR repeat-like domain